jgi:hypothetical protein
VSNRDGGDGREEEDDLVKVRLNTETGCFLRM